MKVHPGAPAGVATHPDHAVRCRQNAKENESKKEEAPHAHGCDLVVTLKSLYLGHTANKSPNS